MWPTSRALSLALTVTLAACADGDPRMPMQAGAPALLTAPVTTNVCPAGTTTPGIDVSKWQGAIDWPTVRSSGVRFAFIRVSDGTGYYDGQFQTNWSGAQAAGVLRGAYQFFRADEDAVAQADLLVDTLETHGVGELPPVIDVETTEGLSGSTIASRVGQWLDRVESRLGVKGIIYTGSYFWEDNIGSAAFADHPLWIAHWTSGCPTIPSAWSGWAFHQYSATGSVPGISGDVDLDRFDGTVAQLAALGGSTGPTGCTGQPGYPACDGATIQQCDASGQVVSTTCPAGGRCSLDGGPHCVAQACWSNLAGGENGTFCAAGGQLGTCTGGQYNAVTCPSGQHCEGPAGSASCTASCTAGVPYCASDRTVGACVGGTHSETDCAASGRYCSTQSGTARCVDPLCAPSQGGSENHAFCVDTLHVGRCTQGAYGLETCAPGTQCFAVAGGAQCLDPSTPPVDTDPVEADVITSDSVTPDGGGSDALGPDGGPYVLPVQVQSSARFTNRGGDCGVGGAGGPGAGFAFALLALLFARRALRRA